MRFVILVHNFKKEVDI